MTINDALAGAPRQLLIGGRWLDGDEQLSVVDPSTEATIATVAGGSPRHGLAAVDAAHDALPAWSRTPPRERGEILRRGFELMTARSDELARICVLENGKTFMDARAEVAYAAEFFRWYSEESVRLQGTVQTAPSGRHRILTLHQPIGVSLLVTPWNFPLAMATRKIGPRPTASTSRTVSRRSSPRRSLLE